MTDEQTCIYEWIWDEHPIQRYEYHYQLREEDRKMYADSWLHGFDEAPKITYANFFLQEFEELEIEAYPIKQARDPRREKMWDWRQRRPRAPRPQCDPVLAATLFRLIVKTKIPAARVKGIAS